MVPAHRPTRLADVRDRPPHPEHEREPRTPAAVAAITDIILMLRQWHVEQGGADVVQSLPHEENA